MTMCKPSLQLMEACFEKCGLGLGGAPKPLPLLALCLGDNFSKLQQQKQHCPVAGEFMKKCQDCVERKDCFWAKMRVPEELAAEFKAYFGDGVIQFSHQLESLGKGISEKDVRLEFPVAWLLAHYGWNVPTALPFSATDRDVNVIVATKGHQSLIIAPVVGDGMESTAETAILSFHETIKESEEFSGLRDALGNSTLSSVGVLLMKDITTPPVRGSTYAWLIAAYVLPYLLRCDDIEGFLSSVNGVPREAFLQVVQPLEVDVLKP